MNIFLLVRAYWLDGVPLPSAAALNFLHNEGPLNAMKAPECNDGPGMQ